MASSTGTALTATLREEFGKGAARRIRRAHQIPAVLYGHGTAPRHISLPGHETMLAVKSPNALLDLTIEGGEGALAIVKDIQIDPVKRAIEHLDLVVVRRGERLEVNVPLHVTGEAAAETVVTLESTTIAITAEATALPDVITVDVTGAEAGTHITGSQLQLPAGTQLAGDAEATVVSVVAAPSAAALEAELAEAEAEAGIERDAPETDEADTAETGSEPAAE